ncbi:MAG: hypothetical protein HQM09_05470 [Candidatus Riflebacteria bacterium]|nr:hypothetical protein [Candidatus Riflebacteria bacterium]
MSVVRFVMLDRKVSQSGLIPSSSIATILLAVAEGARDNSDIWRFVKKFDPGLEEHFHANQDPSPLLEGIGDGLFVISWEHSCIESFQEFQPLGVSGFASPHNGQCTVQDKSPVPYHLGPDWHVIDHFFEEP